MRALPIRIMDPEETRTLPFEFAAKLASGDTLTGLPTVEIAPAGLTSPDQTVSGTRVYVRLEGGTDGADYTVGVLMATALGDELKLSATVQVRAGAN